MKILDFPLIRQSTSYDCGPNAVQAILVYYGINIRMDALLQLTQTTELGTSIPNIEKTFNYLGLETHSKSMGIEELIHYVNEDIPVLVALQAWPEKEYVDWKNNWKDGHYVDVIGYDHEKIMFMDPSCFHQTSLLYKNMMERWHDVGTDKTKYLQYGIAVFGKEPQYTSKKIVSMD